MTQDINELKKLIEIETKKQNIADKISYPFAVSIIIIIIGLLITKPEEEIIKNWAITAFILGGILIFLRFLTETFFGGRIKKYQIEVILEYTNDDETMYKKLKGMLNSQVNKIYRELLSKITYY